MFEVVHARITFQLQVLFETLQVLEAVFEDHVFVTEVGVVVVVVTHDAEVTVLVVGVVEGVLIPVVPVVLVLVEVEEEDLLDLLDSDSALALGIENIYTFHFFQYQEKVRSLTENM